MPRAATINDGKGRRSSQPTGELAMLRDLFDGSPDAVQVDDMDGRIVFANGAWLSLFHVDADNVEGAEWTGLVMGRLIKEEVLSGSWSRCKKGEPAQGSVALKMDGDGLQHVSYTRVPVRTESGEVCAVLSIFRPEESAPGDQDFEDAVHGLKNAFTAIIAGSQLIERQNGDIPGLVSKADLIQRSASRGLRLIERLGRRLGSGVFGTGKGEGS